MKFLKWLFGLFSPYVNSFERKVDKFFSKIKSTDNIANIREKLLELMQENLIVVNVWLEKKFKGYMYLDKKTRREMYSNVGKMKEKFEEFQGSINIEQARIREILNSAGLEFPNGDEQKIEYLAKIMAFLTPGKYYEYIKTSSFGKLLKDPNIEKFQGDCNQIVTLYIYFYSLKFPLNDLKIKLLPEHVCLHFRGIDIEATNGQFAKYTEYEEILPVTEIISTNLLDLNDFREDVQIISDNVMLKSAQLAYATSSLKSLVAKNLDVAYKNIGVSALNVNDFKTAIFYLSKVSDARDVLKTAYHNAAVYYLNNKDFQNASFYASKDGDPTLIDAVKKEEASYKYNQLVQRVSSVQTVADAKNHKSDYQEMLSLAQKMGDTDLQNKLRDTLNKIV